jgi:hypothetical protein
VHAGDGTQQVPLLSVANREPTGHGAVCSNLYIDAWCTYASAVDGGVATI